MHGKDASGKLQTKLAWSKIVPFPQKNDQWAVSTSEIGQQIWKTWKCNAIFY